MAKQDKKEGQAVEDFKEKDDRINPFLQTLSIDVFKVYGESNLVNLDDYEVTEDDIKEAKGAAPSSHRMGTTFYIEKNMPCSVYGRKWIKDEIFKLDNNSIRLFLYIVGSIGKESQRVRINKHAYMAEAGIGLRTFYKTINDLIKHNIINRWKPNIFWVNPAILYRGNRPKNFKQYLNELALLNLNKLEAYRVAERKKEWDKNKQ